MQAVILEMNGEKVSKTLNYLPTGRGWYNCVIKGEKQQRFSNPEEVMSYLKSRQNEDIVCYIKVPAQFHAISVDNLRIA